jgi:hypothetical protein
MALWMGCKRPVRLKIDRPKGHVVRPLPPAPNSWLSRPGSVKSSRCARNALGSCARNLLTTFPEMVSPPVEGYFRLPAVWIGQEPAGPAVNRLNPAIHHATVLSGRINKQLTVRVRRDGLFLFDFSNWDRAPSLTIPAYTTVTGQKVPANVTAAEDRAENYATIRAQFMNVHQACLVTAEHLVFRRSAAAIGVPVDSSNTIKSWDINSEPGYHDDTEDYRSLAMNVMNNAYNVARPNALPRRILELPVIERSFSLLESILEVSETDLISCIDLLYIAAYRYWEKRFSESVVLSWTVSEKLINVAWKRYLKDKERPTSGGNRIGKRRREQLTSARDYTAAVMCEILELSDVLSFPLYEKLSQSRRSRNSWAHGLTQLLARDASLSIAACQELLAHLFGVKVSLSFGYRGGVPLMPATTFAELRRQTSGERDR